MTDHQMIVEDGSHHLRILIANERATRLEALSTIVMSLGHTVIARELNVDEVGQVTREERPDIALVGLGESSGHALDHISRIVHEAACPVIALLGTDDPSFVNEAAKRGVFAYITDGDAAHLQGAIEIVLRRFAEYQTLEGAFGRRAVIERAKGVLMERHGVREQNAFELLRDHSQHTGRKLYDIAEAVLESHLLLSQPRPDNPG